jgi:putative Holliday junction resolvase
LKGRLIALDIGAKRIGVARTDILQISLNAVGTYHVNEFMDALENLLKEGPIEALVVGWPLNNGEEGKATERVQNWINRIQKIYPNIPIIKEDESNTSIEAKELQFKVGMGKKKRKEKAAVDRIAAVLILKRYLCLD